MNDEELPEAQRRPKLEISFDDESAPPAPPPATTWLPPAGATPLPAPPPPPPGPVLPKVRGVVDGPPPPGGGGEAWAIAAMQMNRKSPGVAVLLSLLLTGAGQIYCGRAGRGIAFFAAGVVSAMLILVVVGLILLPVVWIWAAIDAATLANRQNAALLAASRPPGY